MSQDTICAISTAPGTGGVAVIRVSGYDALSICNHIFRPKKAGNDLLSQKAYTLKYGSILNGEEVVDEVLIAVYLGPNSFTGENTVEINCHGSIYIQQKILQLLIENGCRTALPGEFTQRAFLNGKMDLSQAEAVADLIASTSAGMHKLALNQMRGDFSNQLMKLREQLLNFTSLIELELDFSEEDVEFADRSHLKTLATEIESLISKLADSFSVGNAIKNGIPVAIIGETNAGKSTILNQLVGEEKAIVSDIHGTTRDVIEDTITINGILFRFIDTAGIRETNDTIESLGIERSFRKMEKATIILWVIDSTSPTTHTEDLSKTILPKTEGKKLIILFNKTDKLTPEELKNKEELFKEQTSPRLYISAKSEKDIEALRQELIQTANLPDQSKNDIIVTNIRHYEALSHARTAIHRVREDLEANISGDFLSQDIRECMHYLGEITGQISNDEVLANIFSKFCIGK
ncbi:tRNA uridine-5-carboxymethylaminomethyl(34) synthesis GTPase MnmE [Massilibacteroides vaginae]|uniref:tRNA uridine-5-carboxymethylaminomethyl(34) synthesis GTPase MnmE n=1 Tax=Massilibacteroides vaginae TaxID=1673718 RepID=UPI0015949655|nr:tRNA uridine-5-carboxymethylaminomethyl(34) synthesis GTPase MnmE [Massilibacteroides vaginae]